MAIEPDGRRRGLLRNCGVTFIVVFLVLVLAVGAFPASWTRNLIERKLSALLGTDVRLGEVTRHPFFSFTPDISVHNLRIAQPAWAGRGHFLRVGSATVRVPVFALLAGNFSPREVRIDGLDIALVRRPDKRSNWKREGGRGGDSGGSGLSRLTIANGHFSLRDERRGLAIAGPLGVNTLGLRLSGQGTFLDTPVRFEARGAPIAGVDPAAPYPFQATLDSPALRMSARGTMDGALNTGKFRAKVTARAPTLENLDRIIEAGLFGSQPIDLSGDIRHSGRDWFIDRIAGSVGRSQFVGRATVLKRNGRAAIDASIHASQFDFNDLASDEGLSRRAATIARIGPRVIPDTRINLAKIGKTDGRMAFVVDRLLFDQPSVFRSLKVTARMDHRLLRVSDLVATLDAGRLTGRIQVDHRSGRPKFSTDLTFEGATLAAIMGSADAADAPVRGRVRLSGTGDTIREALSHADGRIAMVAGQGMVKATVADVLGQDLGNAIGHAISGQGERVALRCLVADFRADKGIVRPAPLAVETAVSTGTGRGSIALDGERIALTISGAAKNASGLRIVEPLRIGGTLSAPTVEVAGLGRDAKPSAGTALKLLGRSIKDALGIGKNAEKVPLTPLDCVGMSRRALG